MLIACLSVYNERELLPAAIESVRSAVDFVVVVDGAYADFPYGEAGPASTDGTINLALDLADETILCGDKPWPDQAEKRTRYFVGGEGDWYLVIDADERLAGKLDRELLTKRGAYAYTLNVADAIYRQPCPWIRLIKHSPDLCYRIPEESIWRAGALIRPEIIPNMRSARLDHVAHLRSAERKAAAQAYYEWQQKTEKGFRVEHGYY